MPYRTSAEAKGQALRACRARFHRGGDGAVIVNPSNLRQRSFAPLLKRAGLVDQQITFHDLRHTCASLLFQKNVHPKFVQELLGHASVAITLDTYSHMLPGMGREAAVAIEKALL